MCGYGLKKLLKERTTSKNLKIQLYRTLIRPVVMYGYETWTLRKGWPKQNFDFSKEKKSFRTVFWRNHEERRIRKNEDDCIECLILIWNRKKRWLRGHAWGKGGTRVRLVRYGAPKEKKTFGMTAIKAGEPSGCRNAGIWSEGFGDGQRKSGKNYVRQYDPNGRIRRRRRNLPGLGSSNLGNHTTE